MGVFKWLRRERVTVTSHHSVGPGAATPDDPHSQSATQVGTIRTEQYKRDLAEFQARRSAGAKELNVTPVKKKCGRHSLPISCANCSSDHDHTFNYEKKSAAKYKKHKQARSTTPENTIYDGVPNIQFLFQNQVFMPGGGVFTSASYSEPQKSKRHSKRITCRSPDFPQRHIDFTKDQDESPPEFFKSNSLPFDMKTFLEGSRSDHEEVDGIKAAGDVEAPNHKDDSGDEKLLEAMSELEHLEQWADDLLVKSPNLSKSDDCKSDTSAYGLPIASARNLDVNTDRQKIWNQGKWGVMPVQIKKLSGVTVEHVRKKRNSEINILRKCRHPNIILLMGIYPDVQDNVHIICERCVDSLFAILHVDGRILSAQTSVQYALDIANALVFLQMHGYIHSELNSMSIMITSHDTAKLADLGPCIKLNKGQKDLKAIEKNYEVYSPEPPYVNIEDVRESKLSDNEPLISANSSETYLRANAVSKPYESFQNSEMYRWQAPELFTPGEDGQVYPCSKSDVYSLCLVLWESCNASIPWKHLTYEKLKEQYTLWKTGVSLPKDGTYPGCLLALLQAGLCLDRSERMDVETLQRTLHSVKIDLDGLGYIIIPARLPTKKSNFSSVGWETSPTDSDASPRNLQLKVILHNNQLPESSTESEKDCSKSDPLYETIKKSYSQHTYTRNHNEGDNSMTKYHLLPEREYSSACSTPIAKLKSRLDNVTPGTLHRSDSTEYCSILSPNRTMNFAPNDCSNNDQSSIERPTAKLSRSFTPKSYKPLHIKVPDCNLDSIKPLIKKQNSMERSSYNFDIKNYSLPTTPIARSNKLRRNAWLSGDVTANEWTNEHKTNGDFRANRSETPSKEDGMEQQQNLPESPETTIPKSSSSSPVSANANVCLQERSVEPSPASVDTAKDFAVVYKRLDSQPVTSPEDKTPSHRPQPAKSKIDEECLANMNVKPLVAIHERWIYEANRKAGRSMSLPEENSFRSQIAAVKPASHCVDTLQKSLPQLSIKKSNKSFRMPPSPNNNGMQWDQFSQAREAIARSVNFPPRDHDRYHTWRREYDKENATETKIDQCTDTKGIEDFIRDLIRKEFQHLVHEMSDDTSPVTSRKHEEILNKGVANVMESLHSDDGDKRSTLKSFSRVKINGNNKPLLQITFSRSGENSLQVLDNCVNVTICDSPQREKINVSLEDTLTEDMQGNALKRCQAFNAIQEARSTEDLYIDDDLSTQMQENFGGRVKLIPLHGSLHEILCEKEDECCLIKVKQENGCDTIYFRCDNSDTESRDAIDGRDLTQDTVVFKRSISLVEERIQRLVPKEKRAQTPIVPRFKEVKIRPKSEVFAPISRETRVLSNSSPALATNDKDEVEVNIENVMCYQDSSSEECLKCQDSDDFELLEKAIEEDMANKTLGCGCLEKISEENLSVLNDEAEKEVK